MNIPSTFQSLPRVLSYRCLRSVSKEALAYTDLFVPPFSDKVEWKSGLGGSIHLLYGWVRSTRPAVIVEIGSARGRSACAMALACRQNGTGRVYGIDPHTANDWTDGGTGGSTYDFFVGRLRRYRLTVWCEVIRATSDQAAATWDRPIDLLFIDGDHTYEGVRRDYELFAKWVRPRGMVAFHDSLWEHHPKHPNARPGIGVPRFMEDLRRQGFHLVTADAFPGLTLLNPGAGGLSLLPSHPPTSDAS